MAAAAPVCNAAPDVLGGGCDNRKRGLLECWSVGVLETRRNPLLHYSISSRRHGTARNFCWIRSSGYLGKKASAMKTLFGARSRVAIVSLYSTCSCGLIKTVPGVSVMACLSDHFVSIFSADFLK